MNYFIEQKNKSEDPYAVIIANYLIRKARTDILLADSLNLTNKSLDKMMDFITEKAMKEIHKNRAMIADEKVYSWAIEYYFKEEKEKKAKVTEEKKHSENLTIDDFLGN